VLPELSGIDFSSTFAHKAQGEDRVLTEVHMSTFLAQRKKISSKEIQGKILAQLGLRQGGMTFFGCSPPHLEQWLPHSAGMPQDFGRPVHS
jgi:hypothetical protein